jgi:hypothetical protein
VDVKSSLERREPDTFESASRAHIASFLQCVRNRKEPVATIEMGQRTSVVCCMAMESLKQGRRVRWNPEQRNMEV